MGPTDPVIERKFIIMIEAEVLRALCQRIIHSGELGRSKTYAAILNYLAEQSINGSTPKEVAIAMDVLGRDTDFDVGKDSIVRVHIYHLRNKLNAYYARQGKQEAWRLDIPKGQYMLVSTPNTQELPAVESGAQSAGNARTRLPLTSLLAGFALVLLALNLWVQTRPAERSPTSENPFRDTLLWQPLLDGDQPILLLIGDYYIMGETDPNGNVLRMVREFDLNSSEQLRQAQQEGKSLDYLNLDLSYTPTSIAPALLALMKVLGSETDRLHVKLMSEFSTTDLVGNHVVYLGYLSGLQSLTDLAFAASNLGFGSTFDELVNLDTDQLYTSSSGLSVGENSYSDYGMLSSFPSPAGSHYVIVAGMRDEGLINLAEEISNPASLHSLETALPAGGGAAFEALYEVRGFDNTNFDAHLVYSALLDTQVLWESRLIGGP